VFDVLAQMGTLVAVLIYFWGDLVQILRAVLSGIASRRPFEQPEARLGWLIVVATLPAVVGGLLLKSQVEAAFSNARATGGFLLVTAVLLLLAEWVGKRDRSTEGLNWQDAILIGLFQVLAIFPGVSRSGSTIAGGMVRRLDRQSATRFAFLMAVPVMPAAGLVSFFDLLAIPEIGSFLLPLAVGFVTSAIFGYLAIRWLIAFLSRHSLIYFAAYVFILGILVLIVL